MMKRMTTQIYSETLNHRIGREQDNDIKAIKISLLESTLDARNKALQDSEQQNLQMIELL